MKRLATMASAVISRLKPHTSEGLTEESARNAPIYIGSMVTLFILLTAMVVLLYFVGGFVK